MSPARNSFPFPHYENENTLSGNRNAQRETGFPPRLINQDAQERDLEEKDKRSKLRDFSDYNALYKNAKHKKSTMQLLKVYFTENASYGMPPHLSQQQDTWNRLHGTATLASIRREVWYSEPEISKDSLDFNLSSLYNHHEDLLKNKSQVVLHKETFLDDHGTLKGLEPVKKYTSVQLPTSKGITVRHWVNPVKESIHHIEGAIESPHTAATNSGYSRKENGGIFYH